MRGESRGACERRIIHYLCGMSQVSPDYVYLSFHLLPTPLHLGVSGAEDGIQDAREEGTPIVVDRARSKYHVPASCSA